MTPAWRRHLPAGTDPATVDLLTAGTLPRAWARAWSADPTRKALHDATDGWISAGELEVRSAAVAGRFLGSGLVPGDRVLLCAQSSIHMVAAHVGALRAGLVVVPMNTAYTAREIAHIVGDAGPAAAIVDDAERARWIREADDSVVCVGPSVDLPSGSEVPIDRAAPGDPAIIGYTSGTTGEPKGAVLSHANLLSSVEALRLAWRWTPGDRLVLALPLFHMHGLGVGLHGTLLAGASAVLLPGFDPAGVLDAAHDHDASLFFGVPTMYTRLAGSPRAGELSRLRLCVSGSAPMSADLHAQVEATSGQRVLERYGMTETVMLVSNPYDGERRPGTVGIPLPGVDLRLDDDPPTGEPGEVLVRGPNVFSGYRNRPDATADSFTDGWFRTGDVGTFDADGYLTLVARAKELVISGGYNVYPREVEDVLRAHPGVADVAVAGTPSPEWGEVVTAWVVPARPGPGPDADELRDFAAGQLARYKLPRIVHIVGELPVNALGKVQKHLLAR